MRTTEKKLKQIIDDLDLHDAKTTLYCYLRVSTKKQEEEGGSIESQRMTAKKIASKLGFTYVEMNEGGQSSSSGYRVVFEELKKGMRNGVIKHIWYFSRSRWTRTTIEDGLVKKDYLKQYNIKVYEGENGSLRNFNDAKDEMLDTILTSVQQYDRQQRSEVSAYGKMHRSRSEGKNGVFMGGTINFGYSNVDSYWKVNQEEQYYVKEIFNRYVQGQSLNEIKHYLDTNNISPRRSKLWNIGTIHTMLSNRVYLGEYEWVEGGKKNIGGEVFDIRFDAIISQSLFNRVQKQLDKNRKNRGSNLRQYTSLLSDFLVCSCGERILGNVRQTQNFKVYFCSSKNNKWKGKSVDECNNRRTMNMDLTDEFVLSQVKEVMGNSSILKSKFKEDVLNKKFEKEKLESETIELEKEFLEKRIKKINSQIELTIKSYSTNEVNHMLMKTEDAVYKEIKKTLDEEKGNLEDTKLENIKKIEDLDNRKEWVDWITQYGENIKKQFDNVSIELLEGMIDTIEVSATFDKNRDGIEKQVGHKLIVNFKKSIVGDSIEYLTDVKSDGYNVIKGKKKLDVGNLAILKGGRGKSSKKKQRN